MPDSATLNDDDRAELEGVDDEGAKEDEEEDEEKLDEEVEVDGCLRSGLLAAAEIAPPDSFASVSFAKHRSQTRTASEIPEQAKHSAAWNSLRKRRYRSIDNGVFLTE